MAMIASTTGVSGKRKEIYKYDAPWTIYGMNWSVRPDKRFRLALGSFVEEYNNKVWLNAHFSLCFWKFQLIEISNNRLLQVQIIYLDEETAEFVVRATFDHPYPTTKIIWIPDSVSLQLLIGYKLRIHVPRLEFDFIFLWKLYCAFFWIFSYCSYYPFYILSRSFSADIIKLNKSLPVFLISCIHV